MDRGIHVDFDLSKASQARLMLSRLVTIEKLSRGSSIRDKEAKRRLRRLRERGRKIDVLRKTAASSRTWPSKTTPVWW